MTQSVSIPFDSLDSNVLKSFLAAWEKIGSWEKMKEGVFKLIGNNNEKSVLSIQSSKIQIDGNIPSNAKDLIQQLSDHLHSKQELKESYQEAEDVLEGEFIGKGSKNQSQQDQFKSQFQAQFQQFQWKNLPLKSKLKFGLFALLAIPLLILMIPIAIFVIIIKVITFKLFHR